MADFEARECPKCGTALALSMDRTQIRRADSIAPPPRSTPSPLRTLDDEPSGLPTTQHASLPPPVLRPASVDSTLVGDSGQWEQDLDTNPRERMPGSSDRTVSMPFPEPDGPLTMPPSGAAPAPQPMPQPLPIPKKVASGIAAVPANMRRTISSPSVLSAGKAAMPTKRVTLEATEPVGRPDALTGLKLGEYEVLEKIGTGGMSTVYRARQPKIGKEVAIKVLRTDVVADARDLEQLLHEARVVQAIHHPGIIDIYDQGEMPDGRQYLVMEYLDGESLEQRLERESRIPLAQALPIIDGVMSALVAAHEAGVVHRDIKPGNVFLVKRADGKPWIKLLDFGLARPSARREVSRVAGTPDYISPEHARGKAPGPPADVYSLGVLAFVLATGKLPFPGATAHEVMEKHVKLAAPSPQSFDPSVPPRLNALILKMLEKEPDKRPDGAQIRSELKALARSLSTETSDPDAAAITGDNDAGAMAAAVAPESSLLSPSSERTGPMQALPPRKSGGVKLQPPPPVLLASSGTVPIAMAPVPERRRRFSGATLAAVVGVAALLGALALYLLWGRTAAPAQPAHPDPAGHSTPAPKGV